MFLDLKKITAVMSTGAGERETAASGWRPQRERPSLRAADRTAPSPKSHVIFFFSFHPILTKLGIPAGGASRRPPTNFEENATILSDL